MMSETAWEQGGARPTETGIARVLSAYAVHGGELHGARRSSENPLTLTHVRWKAMGGKTLDAIRAPEEEGLEPKERDAWVQLALHLPMARLTEAAGPQSPWVQLSLPQSQAAMLAEQIERALAQRRTQQRSAQSSPSSNLSSGPLYGSSNVYESQPARSSGPGMGRAGQPARQHPVPPSSPSWVGNVPLGGSESPHASQSSQVPQSPPSSASPQFPQRPQSSTSFAGGYSQPQPPVPPGAQSLPHLGHASVSRTHPPTRGHPAGQYSDAAQGGQQGEPRRSEHAVEVVVLPCIEVELPPMSASTASSDYTRDFARDVATHFSRAAQTLPTAREVRGWLRGGRLILAARLVVGVGSRPASREESEAAIQMLAVALAQRTLPYTRMSLADPSEWAQGMPLPG